jgi:hypothetical protein
LDRIVVLNWRRFYGQPRWAAEALHLDHLRRSAASCGIQRREISALIRVARALESSKL